MSRVFFTCAVVFCLVGCADPPATDQFVGREVEKRQDLAADTLAKLPKFLREDEFTCATIAEAVNHFVDMGEEKAIAAMKALADSKVQGQRGDRAEMRLAFACRALFEPRGKTPLREPRFGGLMSLPHNTMPLDQWPLYPVVHVGASYFVLSESYSLGGQPEPSISHINYCCAEGRFRKDRVPVPTRAQALRDFDLLRKSGPWKALKWKDRGRGFQYELPESSALEYLEAQAKRIQSK